jgi:hypothetical protein
VLRGVDRTLDASRVDDAVLADLGQGVGHELDGGLLQAGYQSFDGTIRLQPRV